MSGGVREAGAGPGSTVAKVNPQTVIREVRVARRPQGMVQAEDFVLAEAAPLPPLGDGQVQVALRSVGMNAGMADRMRERPNSGHPAMALGHVPRSDAVLEVVESRSDEFAPGDLAVRSWSPWREADVVDAGELRRIPAERADLPLENHLTVLGHVGFTAWVGMVHVGQVRETDTVYVSGAAGGVGSCAVQFAAARGARVIGSAGSPEKVALLKELGADAAIDHHDGPAVELLRAAAPDGIDLFFDNVGGDQLEAALDTLRLRGRAVLCGAVSQYGREGAGPRNYLRMIYQELTLRGFTVTEHEDLRPAFESEAAQLVRGGRLHSVHTVLNGFDRVPEAFCTLLTGGSRGRMIVAA
ncbi:NADP-dependent oxidoreductase [Streptomyces hyaluromycini]|uniref:NADP-dependent oxidoreductase n=1 Tax=Streptomyces hyaluromycini TaxID=1377993 RepID=A0ABV1X1E1_9ACTN